jgi:5-methylcytosine-specific restriction protein A
MPRYLVPAADAAIALDLSQQIELGDISRAEAFNLLTEHHGFEAYTANAYINCYRHLRAGTGWKATISIVALRTMLELVASKGDEALYLALQAAHAHVEYFAARGNNRVGLRALLREYRTQLASNADMMPGAEVLADQERRAASDDPAARRARLARASGKPRTVMRLIRDYLRNPDVIAEVLMRAGGVCDVCQSPAPFDRRTDGSPYLEVHHKIRLADGGDDTVDNAIALCPNCHRHQHYG